MIDLKMLRATRTIKRIERKNKKLLLLKNYANTVKESLKEEKKRLKNICKEFSEEEFIKLGIRTGYIEKESLEKLIRYK